jgi:hypothetical protein
VAYADFSAALPLPAHPLAKSGYGKRTVPDQLPHSAEDFAHLATREAEIAGYVDRLPEGAAIGYKALAANIAAYGQQACAKALNRLSAAGNLRLIKEHLQVEDNTFRWVTRTYWSRTPRSDEWWKAFVRDLCGIDVTGEERTARAALEKALAAPLPSPVAARQSALPREASELAPEPARHEPALSPDSSTESDPGLESASQPLSAATTAVAPAVPATAAASAESSPAPSEAYRILSRLGRVEPRMTLSAAECAALEGLAAQWLARGATPDQLTRSLTEGLPNPVHSPGALVRNRLEKKMPPEPIHTPARIVRAVMICMGCETSDNIAPLRGGICDECRAQMEAEDAEEELRAKGHIPEMFRNPDHPVDVARRAAEARAAAGFTRPVSR